MVFLWFDTIQNTFAKNIFVKKFILLLQNEPKDFVDFQVFDGFLRSYENLRGFMKIYATPSDKYMGPVFNRRTKKMGMKTSNV